MVERCFGCSNGTIRLAFSLESTAALPISRCIDGIYAPASITELSSFIETKEAIGSWNLRVFVTSVASQVTVSQGRISFLTSGLRISVGSSACKIVDWTSDSSLNSSIPAGFGRAKILSIGSGVKELHFTNISFSYPDPFIAGFNSSLSHSTAIRTGTTAIILIGKFFSFQDSSPRSTIRPSVCQRSNWLSDTSVACRYTPGGSTTKLIITVGGLNSSVPVILERSKPFIISSILSQHGLSTGSVSLILSGFNFYTNGMSTKTILGASAASASLWRSDSIVVAKSSPIASSSIACRLSIESFGSLPATANASLFQPSRILDHIPSTGGNSVLVRLQLFSLTDDSWRSRYGGTACETSKWWSASSMILKLPRSGSSFQTANLIVTASHANASLLPILTEKSNVHISNISILNISALEILNGSGLGTLSPPAHFHRVGVRFDESASRLCSSLSWFSDSSLSCFFPSGPGSVALSQEIIKNSVSIHVDFLGDCANTDCALATASILNSGFVPSQRPLKQALLCRFFSPFISSNTISASSFSHTMYYSNQMIEISFQLIYNNSQPYTSSSTLDFAEVIVDYHYTAAVNKFRVDALLRMSRRYRHFCFKSIFLHSIP
jgi:hypothetical protein